MSKISSEALEAVYAIRAEAFREASALIMERHDRAPWPKGLAKLTSKEKIAVLDLLEELADGIWSLQEGNSRVPTDAEAREFPEGFTT